MKRWVPGIAIIPLIALWLLSVATSFAAPKRVALFVALCNNATQGIIPVPARIGEGDNHAANLYWGCSDGFSGCFQSSKAWKPQRKEVPEDKRIFERLVYLHSSGSVEVTTEAWKGSEIKACLSAFENALVSGNHDLCAFIGHNTLMDGAVESPAIKAAKPTDAIVLCCVSERYFTTRLEASGVRPRLMTTQLMYPGAFLLRDALPVWAKGGSNEAI